MKVQDIGSVAELDRALASGASEAGASGDNYSVTADNGNNIIMNGGTLHLYQNGSVRIALSEVVEPLKQEGVREFRAGRGGKTEVTIAAQEASLFDPPHVEGELLQDKIEREFVQIVS